MLSNERSRPVDRVSSDLKAPIYTTHSARLQVQILAVPYGAVRGHVVRITDDSFDIDTGAETHTVLWGDLRAAGTLV